MKIIHLILVTVQGATDKKIQSVLTKSTSFLKDVSQIKSAISMEKEHQLHFRPLEDSVSGQDADVLLDSQEDFPESDLDEDEESVETSNNMAAKTVHSNDSISSKSKDQI